MVVRNSQGHGVEASRHNGQYAAGTSENDGEGSRPELPHKSPRRVGHADGALIDAVWSIDEDRHSGSSRPTLQTEDAAHGRLAGGGCRKPVERISRDGNHATLSEDVGGLLDLAPQGFVLGWKGRWQLDFNLDPGILQVLA